MATFHAFEWVRRTKHTHPNFSFVQKQKNVEQERERRDPGRKKEGGCFFRAQRKAPQRCSTLEERKKKRGNEKKMHVSSRITYLKRRNERLTNNTLKKNRVKVARAPSSSSIRITRGNRRGFVLNEEEGEGEEERDGRESFWWGRGRSRANRK